jgi:hypothetical protein
MHFHDLIVAQMPHLNSPKHFCLPNPNTVLELLNFGTNKLAPLLDIDILKIDLKIRLIIEGKNSAVIINCPLPV